MACTWAGPRLARSAGSHAEVRGRGDAGWGQRARKHPADCPGRAPASVVEVEGAVQGKRRASGAAGGPSQCGGILETGSRAEEGRTWQTLGSERQNLEGCLRITCSPQAPLSLSAFLSLPFVLSGRLDSTDPWALFSVVDNRVGHIAGVSIPKWLYIPASFIHLASS